MIAGLVSCLCRKVSIFMVSCCFSIADCSYFLTRIIVALPCDGLNDLFLC